ncbi:hypothetical protein [Nonomuraea sp. NPDC050691]|uniref:hypothetical protein n=1 Tax=Nonomuraea sp. NPDC050691 TaxID=3155661 RepID=UPI0033F974EB
MTAPRNDTPRVPPQTRPVYREEALRHRSAPRTGRTRMPLVISGPSFLALWTLAAALLAGVVVLAALALKAAP